MALLQRLHALAEGQQSGAIFLQLAIQKGPEARGQREGQQPLEG